MTSLTSNRFGSPDALPLLCSSPVYCVTHRRAQSRFSDKHSIVPSQVAKQVVGDINLKHCFNFFFTFHRTECFAAVIITIAVTMHTQWVLTDWWPPHPVQMDTITVVPKRQPVTFLNNIRVVQLLEWLIVVLGSSTSVTRWGATRLNRQGHRHLQAAEELRHRTGLTFLDTCESLVQ